MDHQCWQRPTWIVRCIFLIDVKPSGARAVQRWAIVITSGGGILRVLGYAHNFQRLRWDRDEVISCDSHNLLIEILKVGDHLGPALVSVWELMRRVFHDRSNAFGKRSAGNTLAVKDIEHFPFDSIHFRQPGIVNILG